MKLPSMRYSDGIGKTKQVKFGGLNHSPGAGDGELWDMQNMTGDCYPLLASRPRRHLFKRIAAGGSLGCRDKLYWVDGTEFVYDGTVKGEVLEGKKTFCNIGEYVVILPDKVYYNVLTDTFGPMEAKWTGNSLTFSNGLLYGESAVANTMQVKGVDWSDYFRAGDAVTISGCTIYPANNQTPIIRQIDGDKLYFYENIFALGGAESYTEQGDMSVTRTIPDLLFMCENENRLWGCTRDTLYSSKLGDIFNWEVYDGLDNDSWTITPTSPGDFTGCIAYKGYPTYFKEDHIYKVYGSLPSAFQPMGSATLGLAQGSGASLAVAGEVLFYLSNNGIMAYSGGVPQPICEAFGLMRFKNAVAGSDGLKYYVSMETVDGAPGLYVYDTQTGFWHKEDDSRVTHFAKLGGDLYFLNDAGEIWIVGKSGQDLTDEDVEPPVDWMVEFADFTDEEPNKKGAGSLQLRLELEEGAAVMVWLQYDSDGVWRETKCVTGEGVKHSYYLPITPRRCDHYRIKLTGTGACRIYSIARQFYVGSERKSKPGRN